MVSETLASSSMGLVFPKISINGLGLVLVKGFNLVHCPAAKIIAFIKFFVKK